MKRSGFSVGLILVSVFVALTARAASPEAEPPRLAVVIALDQFRADYLVRFAPYFGADGFRRLMEGGANYQNAHYRYAITKTAPGHASMLTGVFADPSVNSLGKGLFFGNPGQVWIQIEGIAVTIAWTAIVSWIILMIAKVLVGLRPSEQEEEEGLDISQHGESVAE